MKTKHFFVILFCMFLFIFAACQKDDADHQPINTDIVTSLNNYWQYQSDLTSTLESHDGTMVGIQNAILNLGNKSKNRYDFSQIDGMVDEYYNQCNVISDHFAVLARAEDSIVPYGESKGLLSNVAKGIYNKAKDTVVSGGRMVRSGWRVLSGKQSIRQVLNDPESGIPLLSGWAETIQKRNNARDAKIREMILNWNPNTSPEDCNYTIPYDDLPGSTPQEKANAYLNLSDEDPIKMQTRSGVMLWSDDERAATAETAKELGETGVKAVGDAYGGNVGEWNNEILDQMMEEGETPQDCGTLTVDINSSETGNPPIETGKTLIISRSDMPEDNPRITIIMNAPQNLQLQLPESEYQVIALAQDFIRGVYDNLQIAQAGLTQVATNLLKLAENAIIIEDLTVVEGCITVNQPVHAHTTCVSTIGQALNFQWTVSGGTYTGFKAKGTDLTFTPTEEKEYTIAVEISDNMGNHKSRSITVASSGGKLVIDNWEIEDENFIDNKLNPGERATIKLFVTNTGTTILTGYQGIVTSVGFSSSFNPSNVTIEAGQTLPVSVPITINKELSQNQLTLQYQFTTQNQNNDNVLITDTIELPIDFYVTINEISNVVTNRIVNINGKIANPQLTTALLILDNDSEHTFDLNLNNGNFSQEIVLTGSNEEVQHTVYVIAVSGALVAENTMSFSSQVPLMALHCTLTWDTYGTDVDLWVTDPNGERCYWAHRQTASGLSLDVDDVNGYGPENITTPSVIPGDYLVQVHYYSDHDSENAIGTNSVVVIRKGEQNPVNYYGYLSDSGDLWDVTVLHFDTVKGWSIKATDKHSKVNASTLPPKK